jgi:hypothetical protein
MTDTSKGTDREPLTEDRDGPLADKGWHAGATFFEESGDRPAEAPSGGEAGGAEGSSDALPASEAGTGIIPEDEGDSPDSVGLPASESDSGELQKDEGGEPQSWPGKSFGSIPPPG